MGKATILIVEDETIVAADLTNKLVRMGYGISGRTARGEDAIALVRAAQPDLVLMDIRLRGAMDGIETAEQIRRESDVPVIYLTAHSDRATLQRATLTESFGYILKPFEEQQLESHIEMALYKHQTERKLRQSEQQYRLLFEHMKDAFFLAEPVLEDGRPVAWRILDANTAFAAMTGSALERIIGRLNSELIPRLEPILCELIARVAQTGEPASLEIFSNYQSRWYDLRCYSPRPGVTAAIATDTTDRKRMETALRESERRYRAIGESIDYGVWVCAPDGRNIYASPSFLRLVGITQQQCSDFGWGNVLHPDDAERTIAAWKECVRTGGTWDMEHRFRGVDGQWHPILARGVPVRDEQGQVTCWVGINLDISRLKRTEAALRDAQAKLQAHADELEQTVARRTVKLHETIGELEHFSYAITHDLRAPLRAMQSFADLTQDECAGCEHPLARQYLRRIKNAANRMDQLITDSLNYSKAVRQELTLGPVALSPLLLGLVESYPNLQADKADITITGDFPLVLGNEAALTQCFSNLLDNAVKFVPPGVRPKVRVWAEAGAKRVRVWIEDNGIGIEKGMQARLFMMFQRASKDYEGTGIGLVIVRKVVQRMGGEVGVESGEGRGSRFWVDLPLCRSEDSP